MAYLVYIDYLKQIQDANLTAIISTSQGNYIRSRAERVAQDEVISYLTQKYDVSKEFKSTEIFSMATKYRSGDLVYLYGDAWSGLTAYTTNQIVSKGTDPNKYVYVALQNGTNKDPATEPTYWKKLGTTYDLFFITSPYEEFNINTDYVKGDRVWWKNKIYIAQSDSSNPGHESIIQYPSYANLPYKNVFPDTPKYGAMQWGTGVEHSVTGLYVNALPADFTAWSSVTSYSIGNRVSYSGQVWEAIAANTNKTPGTDITNWNMVGWTEGDNRSQQIITYMIDICLYHLHARIAPRNIPQLRIDRYRDAIAWLEQVAKGNLTANFPLLQPSQGSRTRWGSSPKLNNEY